MILDGYFGEDLENSEQEETKREYLYEPLSDLVDTLKLDLLNCKYTVDFTL